MTFSAKIDNGTEVQIPYFHSFEHFQETWIVHHPRIGNQSNYQVSHKDTGTALVNHAPGVPKDWQSIELAQRMAIEFMVSEGDAAIKEAIRLVQEK